MATAKQLRALRKKYRLGEFSPSGKRKKPRPGRTYYVRGKSRTPTITRLKRTIRREIRKLPKRARKGLNQLGRYQGFNTTPFRL